MLCCAVLFNAVLLLFSADLFNAVLFKCSLFDPVLFREVLFIAVLVDAVLFHQKHYCLNAVLCSAVLLCNTELQCRAVSYREQVLVSFFEGKIVKSRLTGYASSDSVSMKSVLKLVQFVANG